MTAVFTVIWLLVCFRWKKALRHLHEVDVSRSWMKTKLPSFADNAGVDLELMFCAS